MYLLQDDYDRASYYAGRYEQSFLMVSDLDRKKNDMFCLCGRQYTCCHSIFLGMNQPIRKRECPLLGVWKRKDTRYFCLHD